MRQIGLAAFATFFAAACSSSAPSGSTQGTGGSTGVVASTGATSSAATSHGTAAGSSSSGATAASTTSGAGVGSTASSTGAATASSTGSSGGGPVIGDDCQPANDNDPCTDAGLACQTASDYLGEVDDGGQGGNCELPVELDGCETSVGCAQNAGLACTSLQVLTLQADICVRSCSTNADCPLPYTTCAAYGSQGQTVCFYNFCGGSPPFVSQQDAYYTPCTASDAGAGTCVPVENAQFGTVGVCIESGTVADGGTCTVYRDGGEPADECGDGEACDGILFGGTSGACRQVCSFGNDAGPSCTDPQQCVSVDTFGVPSDLAWGVCLTPCSSGSATCGANAQCLTASEAGPGTPGFCYP